MRLGIKFGQKLHGSTCDHCNKKKKKKKKKKKNIYLWPRVKD
jgi:hypothetical protein